MGLKKTNSGITKPAHKTLMECQDLNKGDAKGSDKVMYSMRIPADLLERLRAYASSRYETTTAVVIRAIQKEMEAD